MSEWRAYFEDSRGRVLRTTEGWRSPEEAAHWGQAVMASPHAYDVEDPDGKVISGLAIDPMAGLTVETE